MQFVLQNKTGQKVGKGKMQETVLDSFHIDVHDFFSAVFGSYLRPDLVPANPSFYEGSSMGTISTSSIFVNVDNQTEERYGLRSRSCSLFFACCYYIMTGC